MVVTDLPPIALTGNTHERTAWPSRCTVHAPHCATPHPNLVPVRPTISRNTHNSGMSAGTSTDRRSPLTFNTYISLDSELAPRSVTSKPLFGMYPHSLTRVART